MKRRIPTLALLLLAVSARAGWVPPSKPGIFIQTVSVLTEQGQIADLKNQLSGARPTLLLPIFTRCAASCPIMTHALKKAATGTGFQVVLFSFDPGDTAKDLQNFRERESLPADWILVRAASASAARSFLDQFDYNVMNAGGGFIHPNEIFVLSPRMRWSGLFAGEEIDPQTLRAAFDRAQEMDHPALWNQLKAEVRDPQNRVIAASLGLLISIGVIFQILWRRQG